MQAIKPSFEILRATTDLENLIEIAGRVCYKSEDKITPDSAVKFIGRLQESKHESVLEHGAITVKITCDRGVSHELVRHRIASYSQESTRYVNYAKEKYGAEITVIDLSSGFNYDMLNDSHKLRYELWKSAMENAERAYMSMLSAGASPQEARSVLPNSTKTEVVITTNPREWLHIFKLRTAQTAHPQMREIMIPLQTEFQKQWPAIFGSND